MGRLKISSELPGPLDHWNLAWATGPYLGLMERLKISSELLRRLDYWYLAWSTELNLGRMSKMRFSRPRDKVLNPSETIVKGMRSEENTTVKYTMVP